MLDYHLWYGNGKYAYSIDSNGHLVSLITDITLQRYVFRRYRNIMSNVDELQYATSFSSTCKK